MKARIVLITSFLLILCDPAPSQWVQTNSPQNKISPPGGVEITCLAAIGNNLYAGNGYSGLFRSTDSGSTWTPENNGLTNLWISCLLYTNGKFYAGTGGALFVSTDSGANWRSILELSSSVYPIIAVGVSGENIVVSIGSEWLTFTDLSTDQGVTWSLLDSIGEVSSFVTIGDTLYALVNEQVVFRSTNHGANWTRADTGQKYISRFFVDGGNLYITATKGSFLSTDGGTSWSAINMPGPGYGLIAGNGEDLFAYREKGYGLYHSTNNGSSWSVCGDTGWTTLEICTFLIDNGILYVGMTDGTHFFRSTDMGLHWTELNTNRFSIVNSQIYSFDTIGAKLYACTAGGLFSTTDSGAHWNPDTTGMGAVEARSLVNIGGNLFAGVEGSGVFLSTNDGASWNADTALPTRGLDVSLLAQHDGVLYAETYGDLFISTNSGASWSLPDSMLPDNNSWVAFAVMGGNLMSGTANSIYYSSDSGRDWNDAQDCQQVNALVTVGENVYAGTSTGVWISVDSGVNWTVANESGLTDTNVWALLANGGNLYAGTYNGVFVSTNGGDAWTSIDSGALLNSEVTSLAIKDSILYAGTGILGIWRYSLAAAGSAPSLVSSPTLGLGSIAVYPNPASSRITISGFTGSLSVLDPLGRSYEVKQTGTALDISLLPSGVYFVSDGHSSAKFVKE